MKRRKKRCNRGLAEQAKKAGTLLSNISDSYPEVNVTLPGDLYSVRCDAFMRVATFVVGKMKEVVGCVVDFLKGNWDEVVTAYNAVRDYCSHIMKEFFSAALLSALSSVDSGLYEGSITWKQSNSLGDAAAKLDAACNLLSSMTERFEGSKPVYTVASKVVNPSEGKCVVNVLSNVTAHAS